MQFKGVEICCPHCRDELERLDDDGPKLRCLGCDHQYPVILGIPDLRVFPDPYISIEEDHAKGLRLAEQFDDLDFAQLIEFYYSITPAVPLHHAKQYTRGLLAGVARAEATLQSWQGLIGNTGQPKDSVLLEIGCGTAPLLVASASRFSSSVGIDIAFRWLVVAKKRLDEAGVNVPLFCACAEALPFPDTTFDWIVADSVLELLQYQEQGVQEAFRAIRSSGHLCVTTPNKYSLGPDPHAGILAGGYLPERWLSAYVRRQGGVPPKRKLLSANALNTVLVEVGFDSPKIVLPDIPEGQRKHFGRSMKLLIDIYRVLRRMPLIRQVLLRVGPLLQAVSQKPRAVKPSQDL